jgi:hypothetical protein
MRESNEKEEERNREGEIQSTKEWEGGERDRRVLRSIRELCTNHSTNDEKRSRKEIDVTRGIMRISVEKMIGRARREIDDS